MPHDARVPTETCSARLWTPCQSVIGHRQRLVGLPHRAVLVLVPAVHRAAARVVRAAVVLRCAVRSALCRLPAWARAIDDYLALTHRTHPAVRAPAADIRGL